MLKRLLNYILWRLFPFWEKLGIHLLPVHYFSALPNTGELRAHPTLFTADHPMCGVDMREAEQWRLMEHVARPREAEYLEAGKGGSFSLIESTMPSYAPANALVLYAFIRHFKPRRVIEVGSGMSTLISMAALHKNRSEGSDGTITAIEPYPWPTLRSRITAFGKLIEQGVEAVPMEEFESLEENDILFIDSTHTVKIGGDVNLLFLNVLPRLKPGVLIHVHDIFFPREYLPHHFFGRGIKQIWQEQYLLHAFLIFNSEFEVLLSSSYLHFKRPKDLKSLFPWYHENRCPSSFWMRRKKPL